MHFVEEPFVHSIYTSNFKTSVSVEYVVIGLHGTIDISSFSQYDKLLSFMSLVFINTESCWEDE